MNLQHAMLRGPTTVRLRFAIPLWGAMLLATWFSSPPAPRLTAGEQEPVQGLHSVKLNEERRPGVGRRLLVGAEHPSTARKAGL